MIDNTKKQKGVADIVFAIDSTGSMGSCIRGLTNGIGEFVETLQEGDANSGVPIKDWRIKVVGYRDVFCDGDGWLEDKPFSDDVATVRENLDSLVAGGGGDEPESLLDAVHYVAELGQTGMDDVDPNRWRSRSKAHRIVIVFSDASYHPTMKNGGTEDDVFTTVENNRVKLFAFVPEHPCYSGGLDELDGAVIDTYKPEPSPQKALRNLADDKARFSKVLETVAKTISKTVSVDSLESD